MTDQQMQMTLENVVVGMKLSRPVLHADGHQLIDQNIELSESTIQCLRSNGILTVWVFSEDNIAQPDQASVQLQRSNSRVARLFRHSPEDAEHRYLFELIGRYRRGVQP